MARSTLLFLLLLSLLACLLGYNYFLRPLDYLNEASQSQIVEDNDPMLPPFPGSPSSESYSNELFDKLAVREQITQLIAFPYLISAMQSTQSASLDWIKINQPAIVSLFGEKISTSSALINVNKIKAVYTNNSQPLIAVDHEGGLVQRLSGIGFTRLPSWQTLCASNAVYRQELLEKSAQELSAVGINIVFAPVIDLASNSAVLGSRVCGERADVVVERAKEAIDVYQEQQILSVIKHFPGIGEVKADLHHEFDVVELTEEGILAFRELLTTYPNLGVMSTHVGVKDFYEDLPCSLNQECLGDLKDFFPETLIFSDALDMDSAGFIKDSDELLSLSQRAINALLAGNNVLVFGPKVESEMMDEVVIGLVEAYESDPQLKELVQNSLEKLWLYKELLQQ